MEYDAFIEEVSPILQELVNKMNEKLPGYHFVFLIESPENEWGSFACQTLGLDHAEGIMQKGIDALAESEIAIVPKEH